MFATTSAAVAAAVEAMIREAEEREAALAGMADEIRRRMETPREEFLSADEFEARLIARHPDLGTA